MRVTVDQDMCEGHGICVDIAPEIFVLREDGLAEVILADPPAEMNEAAGDAARRCPASAISVTR